MTFPNTAARVTDNSKRNIFTSRWFVPQSNPAENKRASPGKKKPKNNPVSIKMMSNTRVNPPYAMSFY